MTGTQEDTTVEIVLWADAGDTMIPIYLEDLPESYHNLYKKDPVRFTEWLQQATGMTVTVTITRKITARGD